MFTIGKDTGQISCLEIRVGMNEREFKNRCGVVGIMMILWMGFGILGHCHLMTHAVFESLLFLCALLFT